MRFLTIGLPASLIALSITHSVHAEDWSGQYAGFMLGATQGQSDVVSRQSGTGFFTGDDSSLINNQGSRNLKDLGVGASVLWGYNLQSDNTVYGVEADLSKIDFKDGYNSGNVAYNTAPGNNFAVNTRVRSDWVASLRPRAGFADGNALYYASAGVAAARFKYSYAFTEDFANESTSASSNKTKFGWTLGVGYEQKLQDGWAVKADYLHYNFDNAAKTRSTLAGFPNEVFNNNADFTIDTIRIGVTKAF